MGNRKISVDVKLAAIHLYEQGILELHDILNCIGFSRRTFYQIKRLYDETGHVVKPRSEFLGRPSILNLEDLHYLLELVHHRPDYFLDELTNLMESNRFISVYYYTTIHRELVRVSLKKLRKIAKERNEDLRANFKRRIAQYLPHELMFIDETSKDEQTQCRRWGRAKKSCRACMRGPFVRRRRFTVVAALTLDGVVAGHVVEGSLRRNGYLQVHICAILFLFLGFATCFGGRDGSHRGSGTGVGMGFIASSSRSMLSRAESRSLPATTMDDPLDEEELKYGLGDVISSSVSLMYSELSSWTCDPCYTTKSPKCQFFTKSFFWRFMFVVFRSRPVPLHMHTAVKEVSRISGQYRLAKLLEASINTSSGCDDEQTMYPSQIVSNSSPKPYASDTASTSLMSLQYGRHNLNRGTMH